MPHSKRGVCTPVHFYSSLKAHKYALAGVAQWVECQIPSWGCKRATN